MIKGLFVFGLIGVVLYQNPMIFHIVAELWRNAPILVSFTLGVLVVPTIKWIRDMKYRFDNRKRGIRYI